MATLESDLLRTFIAVADAGSIGGGAARVHRSQSAVSTRIKQLETVIGRPLFARHGRGVVLNEFGESLMPTARRVVSLLNTAFADLSKHGLEGTLHVGISDDHSRERLSQLLADFSRDHPKVGLKVRCALSADFPKVLTSGELDMAIYEVPSLGPRMILLQEEPLFWVASRSKTVLDRNPVPIALFDRACWWRDIALTSLEQSGKPYNIVVSSESSAGVSAAIRSGVAIGILGKSAISDDLIPLGDEKGLPPLTTSKLALDLGPHRDNPIRDALSKTIMASYSATQRGAE